VFVNRVLRRIFGLKNEEVTGGFRKFRSSRTRTLANIMIRSRRIIWTEHVA
jgi:hypothetical protein